MSLNANSALVFTQNGGRAYLRFNGTSGNVQVWSNSTVNADVSSSNSTLDPIIGAKVTGVWWSVAGNNITVVRVVNSTVNNTIMSLSGSGEWNKDNGWRGGSEFATANLAVTFGASANGVLFLEVDKEYAGGGWNVEDH